MYLMKAHLFSWGQDRMGDKPQTVVAVQALVASKTMAAGLST